MTILQNLLKFCFSRKKFKPNRHFPCGAVSIAQFQETLNWIYCVIKHWPSPLSLHVCRCSLQLDEKILLFFPGIPSSSRARCASVLCNELFSYLAPPHCFSWLCALFTTCLFCSEDKAINLLVVFYFTVCMLLRYTLYLFSLCPGCVRGMNIIQTQVENQGTGR